MKNPIIFVCFGAAFAGFAADAAAKWQDAFHQDKHQMPPFAATATSGSSLTATDAFAFDAITGDERPGASEQGMSYFSRVNRGS